MYSHSVHILTALLDNILYIFVLWRNSQHWVMASSFKRFLDHTQRRTTFGRTPLDEWSARRRDLYRQHTALTTDIHVPGGIRTHNLSRRAAADLRLRSRGQWDRLVYYPFGLKVSSNTPENIFILWPIASSSSSYICHGVGPLVDPFRSHVSRSDSFCQLDSSVSLPWVIYFEAFYLHVVSSFSCIPVICSKLVLFLTPLQFVLLLCNLSNCISDILINTWQHSVEEGYPGPPTAVSGPSEKPFVPPSRVDRIKILSRSKRGV